MYLPWIGGGVLTLDGRVPTLDWRRGTYPGWGGGGGVPTPTLDPGQGRGVLTLDEGGVPILDGEGVPIPKVGEGRGIYLGWEREGVSTLDGEGKGYLPWMERGYLPLIGEGRGVYLG